MIEALNTQYLTFVVAGEEYAIGILQVKEILEYDVVTPVPQTPEFIRGVINLRGLVVPVVDLAVKFGLPASTPTRLSCNVIVEVDLEGQRTTVGLMADTVSQVVDLHARDIEPPPTFGTAVHLDYLRGLGKAGKKFVLILDIEKLLASVEVQQVAAVAESTAGEATDAA